MTGISTRLMLTLMLVATPASADDDCAVPMANWQPREAVVKLAAERGWGLRRIRIDDGCYEVIGRDDLGRAIEVKLDPATLEVVEIEVEVEVEVEGAHDDHRKDRPEHPDDRPEGD